MRVWLIFTSALGQSSKLSVHCRDRISVECLNYPCFRNINCFTMVDQSAVIKGHRTSDQILLALTATLWPTEFDQMSGAIRYISRRQNSSCNVVGAGLGTIEWA